MLPFSSGATNSAFSSTLSCVIVFVKLKALRVIWFCFLLSLFLFITTLATKRNLEIYVSHKLSKFWRKYTTCFKPLHVFLASELIKNLHAATFASMLMKCSGFLHEAARVSFFICKHILSIFWGWKRLFSKHTEAKHKIHYAYIKKECSLISDSGEKLKHVY